MGFYAEQAVPRILDVACGAKMARPLRRRVCDGLTGEVVEIGFGAGHNAPFYPQGVTSVSAVEPSDVAWRLAAKRVRDARVPIRRPASTASPCPSRTTVSTPRCPPGRCAPSRTPWPPCASCAAS